MKPLPVGWRKGVPHADRDYLPLAVEVLASHLKANAVAVGSRIRSAGVLQIISGRPLRAGPGGLAGRTPAAGGGGTGPCPPG
jgi:hypothetical protein